VRGTTTNQIFEEIKAQGLLERDGEYAAGLASGKSKMQWSGRDTGALCTLDSMTIILDLVVTLPRHERQNDLSNHLRERWQHFAAAVAAHEQRHVDIFVNAATAVKARIEAALKKWASCDDLTAAIRDVWKIHEVETEKAQPQFDVEDRGRVDNDRKPLLGEIETAKSRLTALSAEVRQLDATLEDLRRRAGEARQKIDALNAEIAKSSGTCSRPTDGVQALCRQYKTLAVSHDALVAEHSSFVAHRNMLAGEHNTLVEAIKGLTEALNWVY
jgi:predicted secreted Zn-dependent protease